MKPISVLLVDDSATFLDTAARYLSEHGGGQVAVVGTACSGEEALRLAETIRPQVITVDLHMPGLGGLATIGLLRSLLPEAGIIALTFLEANQYGKAAIEAGADEYVPKSALTDQLLPSIQRVAARRRQRGEAREGGSFWRRP